jgi:hypothetical protein
MRGEKSKNGRSKTEKRLSCSVLGHFKTFKQRGEWVELQFMAAASIRGYHILKPWGDLQYDVGIERGSRLLRVQVKSTSNQSGTGYVCQLRRNLLAKEEYSPKDVDLFVAYVLPENAWYIIPSVVILTPTPKYSITLCPVTAYWKSRYRYEHYREAWHLLTQSRRQLSHHVTSHLSRDI